MKKIIIICMMIWIGIVSISVHFQPATADCRTSLTADGCKIAGGTTAAGYFPFDKLMCPTGSDPNYSSFSGWLYTDAQEFAYPLYAANAPFCTKLRLKFLQFTSRYTYGSNNPYQFAVYGAQLGGANTLP